MHETLAVQEVDSLRDLQEDVQALVVLPLLGEAALSHPVLQVLLPAELHLDVEVHLQMAKDSWRSERFILDNHKKYYTLVVTRKRGKEK